MNDVMTFLTKHLTEIILAISGIGAWGYERRKRGLEIEKTSTDNASQVMKLYQDALADLRNTYDRKFKDLESEVQALTEKLKNAEIRYANLKGEFNIYKKKHE